MGYDVGLAISDLRAEKLLDGALLPGPAGAEYYPADELAGREVAGAFAGAGLDSRRLAPGALFVALAGQNVDGRCFVPAVLEAGHWVLTRSAAAPDPLVGASLRDGGGALLSPDPEKALAHLAGCWRRRLGTRVLGITGTNGKTTTKDLARALLSGGGKTQATRGNFNNQLGLPITLLDLRPETRFAVIEMGASAVGDIRYLARIARPDVGLITNASPAHMEKFGSLENIIAGKGELLAELPATGRAILNADSPGFAQWSRRSVCAVCSWGRETGDHRWSFDAAAGALILDGEAWPVPLPGAHNAANLCAAILAARAFGLEDAALRAGLEGFVPSDHRSRLLRWRGRTVLDDSYNANPGSVRAAARTVADMAAAGRAFAVLGPMAELGPTGDALHRETGAALADLGPDSLDPDSLDPDSLGLAGLLAVGDGTGERAARELAAGFGRGAEVRASCAQALIWLREHTTAGDIILVKGSRSAGMDRLVRLMEAEAEEDENP